MFFDVGYGATSIEAVAKRAGVSKRTFYARFDDKPALFAAVVHRTIERMRPPAGVPLIDGPDLPGMLRYIAALVLRAALSPPGLALHRLIIAESARFPELGAAVDAQGGAQEAVRLIAGVLDAEARAGRLALDNATFAAQQFLHMVAAAPRRHALVGGKPMTADEQAAWVGDVVNLFVNGCRGWEKS